MIGEIGWLPSIVRRDLESLRLYNQVVCMNDDRLTKKIFKYDRQCKGSWSQNIINICKCLDVTDSWENESPINIKFAKTELFKAYKRVWLNELVTKSKLHNLSKIKNEMSVSKHVAANLNKHKRSLISQIRLYRLSLDDTRGWRGMREFAKSVALKQSVNCIFYSGVKPTQIEGHNYIKSSRKY